MNLRWGYEWFDFAAVELNSSLYIFEKNMSFYEKKLKKDEESIWKERAEKRKSLMLEKKG